MKSTLKAVIALSLLSISASANAMPEQVPDSWYDHMLSRIDTLRNNPGFCRGLSQSWYCWL